MKKDKYEWMRDELEDIINNWDQDTKDDDVFDLPIYRLPEFLENETSFKLYRYMPPEYYSIRNIETQKIHLSNNGVMNDIFEGIPCGEYIFTTNDLSLLSDTAKMCCFTESPDNFAYVEPLCKIKHGLLR